MPTAADRAAGQRLYLNRDLDTIEQHSFDQGDAAIYTRRRPAKPTDNEDCAALLWHDNGCHLIVADGLGGQPHGADASAAAVQAMVRNLTAWPNPPQAISAAFNAANRALLNCGDGRATTLSLVAIKGNQLHSWHVGDSATLVTGQRGRIKLLTVPHSPVGHAQASGDLTEREAMHHARRYLVSNVMGCADMHPEAGAPLTLALYDTVIVASDGLFDNLYAQEIADAVCHGPLTDAADALRGMARARMQAWPPASDTPSQPDDLTFIVFRLARPGR